MTQRDSLDVTFLLSIVASLDHSSIVVLGLELQSKPISLYHQQTEQNITIYFVLFLSLEHNQTIVFTTSWEVFVLQPFNFCGLPTSWE